MCNNVLVGMAAVTFSGVGAAEAWSGSAEGNGIDVCA